MRFPLLDPLRGLAALWVFVFHFEFSESFQLAFPFVHAVFKEGDLGVPMFFVISGYCITASAVGSIRKSESTGFFLFRRAVRIFPPFWCSVALVSVVPFLMAAMSMIKTGHYHAPQPEDGITHGFLAFDAWEWIRHLTLTQVFYPMPEAYALQYKFTFLNAVYWTLAIEVQFYLVVGGALLWRNHFIQGLLLVTGVSLLSLFFADMELTGIFLPYWPMFAIGVGIFFLLNKNISPLKVFGRHATGITLGSIVLFLGAFLLTVLLGRVPDPLTFSIFFGGALWFAFQINPHFENFLGLKGFPLRVVSRLLVVLGLMSYSVYLLHSRLQYMSMMISRNFFPMGSIAHDLFAIILTCLLIYPFYWFCERPFAETRRLWGRKAGRSREEPGTLTDTERQQVVSSVNEALVAIKKTTDEVESFRDKHPESFTSSGKGTRKLDP